MKEFNAERLRFESASALVTVKEAQHHGQYVAYIGLDVHKDTIAVAVWPTSC